MPIKNSIIPKKIQSAWMIILACLVLSGCGFNGNQRVTTNDSVQTVRTEGEAFTYVVVRMEFIRDVRELCEDLYGTDTFESEQEYKLAVAECTFEKLAILNIDFNPVEQVNNSYCQEDADLSQFTPEQLEDIMAVCQAIGG